MGYCSENDIKNTIAQALTSANSSNVNNFGTYSDLVNIGKEFNKSLVTTDTVNYYIQSAGAEIDSSLSQLYVTPFCEKCTWEGTLFSHIDEYNDYIVIASYCPLASGDLIVLTYNGITERNEIDEVIDGRTFSTVTPIQYEFPEDTRILRVSYAEPLRFSCARLAAANIYDKYFSSESAPNVSEFGNKLRELAYDRINDILKGTIILHGYHRVGRRFYNSNLVEQYDLPKENDISRK